MGVREGVEGVRAEQGVGTIARKGTQGRNADDGTHEDERERAVVAETLDNRREEVGDAALDLRHPAGGSSGGGGGESVPGRGSHAFEVFELTHMFMKMSM